MQALKCDNELFHPSRHHSLHPDDRTIGRQSCRGRAKLTRAALKKELQILPCGCVNFSVVLRCEESLTGRACGYSLRHRR